jgi:exopolysaccharide production protein ExoY
VAIYSGLDLQRIALQTKTPRRATPGQPRLWRAIGIVEQVLALIGLLLALPGLVVAGLVVFLLSGRCPLVAHRRVGKDGREIKVVKLRTMWGGRVSHANRRNFLVEHLKDEAVPEVKVSGDPRVTSRFAEMFRKYSLDELPQLWQVVRGDLSLVGPRPMTASEIMEHYGAAAGEVLRVKPGLTGLWQVKGRSSLNYRQRRRLDLFLVRHRSLRLYAAIILVTIPRVLTGKDAW